MQDTYRDAAHVVPAPRDNTENIDTSPAAIANLVSAGLQVVSADSSLEALGGEDQLDALSLLGAFAHDLRSPLGSVVLLADRLRSGGAGPLTAEQERLLAIVRSAALAMSIMSDDTLDLIRGGTAQTAQPPAAFSMGDILHSVRTMAQPLVEAQRLTLRFSAPPIGRRIGKPAALQRVLLNLVTNALKYTEVGSVSVVLETPTPELVSFSVTDTGPGLSPQLRSLLDRKDLLRAASRAGTCGIGLALAMTLLESMGSHLVYESGVQGGSCFRFAVILQPTA